MSRVQPKATEPRQYKIFTPEQQSYYNRLIPRRRKYVDLRGQGLGKRDAYVGAGYECTKNAAQSAWILENTNKQMAELIEILITAKRAKDVLNAETAEAHRISALAEQKKAEEVLAKVDDDKSGELARQIQFFRDIAEGKIKTVKKTVFTNTQGKKSTKVELISDVDTRIKARKELDRLLGLSAIRNLGNLNVGGNVNIMIVDASKKDELNDERNTVYMDMQDKTEEVNGEIVIITEEKQEKARGARKILNRVVENEGDYANIDSISEEAVI